MICFNKVMNNDLKNQDKICKKLSSAIDAIQDCPELKEKRDSMNEQLRATQANLRDKEAKLQENVRQVKKYLGEVDDAYQWVNDFRTELKAASPCGALPETSKIQFDAFMVNYEELQSKYDATQGLIAKGQELAKSCPPEDVAQISEKIRKLGDRWRDTQERADKRKVGIKKITPI
jgi:DNA repair ATPase RecN